MKTLLVAEIAQAHDGSLGQAHAYIDALKDSGVHIVKFQTHIAHAESSAFESFRTPFSQVDKTRYDYWKRMEFSDEQWAGLKKHCEDCRLEFMSSPFSIAAFKLLERLGVKRYKIGSGELNNYLMLDMIAATRKPLLLSSGMSDWDELDRAIARIRRHHNNIGLLQCTTAYPAPPSQIELPVMAEMKKRYALPVGLSDHSGSIYPSLAAVALGAEVIEFHVCFDRRQFGPDSPASLTVAEVYELVRAIDLVEQCLEVRNNKQDCSAYVDMKKNFGKSLAVNKPLDAGHTISMDDLETKKPAGCGIPASEYEKVLQRTLACSKDAYEFLQWSDLIYE